MKVGNLFPGSPQEKSEPLGGLVMDNRFVRPVVLTIVAALFFTGCAGLSSGRTLLTYDDMMDGFYAESPIEE